MTVFAIDRPLGRLVRTRQTKDAILAAALKIFSTRGYAEAGVRDIAGLARVNPALVTRYFGTKLQLFEVVLEANLDSEVFTRRPRAEFGISVAKSFCASDAETASAVPLLVFAAGDSAAAAIALRLLQRIVIAPLEAWFGTPDAAERTAQMLTVITGFFVYRLMLPVAPLAQQISPNMQSWLARTLQDIVDHKPGPAPG